MEATATRGIAMRRFAVPRCTSPRSTTQRFIRNRPSVFDAPHRAASHCGTPLCRATQRNVLFAIIRQPSLRDALPRRTPLRHVPLHIAAQRGTSLHPATQRNVPFGITEPRWLDAR